MVNLTEGKGKKEKGKSVDEPFFKKGFHSFYLLPFTFYLPFRQRYAGEKGQATTELVLMLALLTAIGILIMTQMVGGISGHGGAVNTFQTHAATTIADVNH